ncbi:16345_t:CDS:2 [Cetraspora pellucida]|uniref:16345_t:CDS:1 n=1 Tax=Cetraspora pellucida TaxID=1433469 RepID=A0A9N9EWE5_9GLOM|nr:16345_t:CDS:2 [Cetraspora pellucida]
MNTQANKTLTYKYLEWHNKFTRLPNVLTDKICFKLYKRYKKEISLDSWINSKLFRSSQIEEDTDNYISYDCIIKIFKFLKEKDVFKYTDSEAKCSVYKKIHTHQSIWGNWSCLGKNDHYFLNCPFRIDQKKVIIAIQSIPEIQYKIDSKKFSVITEAKKNRWTIRCFRRDLKRDIHFYYGGIESKNDPKKYHEFLTDQKRLVSEELLCHSMVKSSLSTA